MRRGVLGTVLSACLLAASSGIADIIRTLENPPNNQEVSGISLISGWVFSTTGSPVALQLFVDGEAAENISCCGPRPDVKALFEVAPLNSGFGLLINFNDRLTVGTHTISVLMASGNEAVIETRTVTVAKPGGRVGEDRLSFGFLKDLDVSTTGSAIDPQTEEVILAPVEVTDKATGSKRKSTLRLAWREALQSFVTVGAASGTEFAAVQTVFNTKCTAACHSGASPAAGLDLSEGHAFRELVPAKSSQDPPLLLISPGDLSFSYLYQKVIASGSIAAGTKRMPPDCSGDVCLSATQIDAIKAWIVAGAPPPQ